MKAPARTDAKAPAESGGGNPWVAAGAALLFLGWLFFPLAYGRFRPASSRDSLGSQEVVEHPSRNGRPWPDFLRDFSLYYEKSNPVRPLILPKFTAFKLYTLGVSSVSSVILGRNHWLFLGQETDKIDERRYFMGTHPFDDKTLQQWLAVFTQRRRWLEERGIAYWLVAVPNKSSIYPEYMPSKYPRGHATRLDQLVEFMKRRAPGFPLIDLRPAMQAGKKSRLLYWPTDTHWNDFGRDLAYREIVDRLARRFPALKALPRDAFEVQPCQPGVRDLEKMLLLPWSAPEPSFRLAPTRPLPSFRIRKSGPKRDNGPVYYRSNAAALRRALIIHDSFGESLKPVLSVHFKRTRWDLDRRHALPVEWIEHSRPSVVIDEFVERYLEEDPWTNPAELRDSH